MDKMIIEKINYMDIDDPKNSWYLDAIDFDTNFPLIYTSRPDHDKGERKLREHNINILYHYNHFYNLAECFSQSSAFSALIIEAPFPNKFVIKNDWSYVRDTMGSDSDTKRGSNVLNRVFEFGMRDRFDEDYISRYILIAPVYDLLTLKTQFISRNYAHITKEDPVLGELYDRNSNYWDAVGSFPFSQLIVTKDWDLVKRYLFFMIRNHQYGNAFLRYNRNDRLYPNERIPEVIMDIITKFQNVPKDYRFGKLIEQETNSGFIGIKKYSGIKVFRNYETCSLDIGLVENFPINQDSLFHFNTFSQD